MSTAKRVLASFLFVLFYSSVDAATIVNAKIGDTVIDGDFAFGIAGHAGIVIGEYESGSKMIIDATVQSVKAKTYKDWSHDNGGYEGHFRSTQRNYTESERRDIITWAKAAIGADYWIIELYRYAWDFDHHNNVPYAGNVIPSDFRCDGLAEWSTEKGFSGDAPTRHDGFYYDNNPYLHKPTDISGGDGVADTVFQPEKPDVELWETLSVKIAWKQPSGASVSAPYALLRKTGDSYEKIYCGKMRYYYIDEGLEADRLYTYKVMAGERTAGCDDLTVAWSPASDEAVIKTEAVEASSSSSDSSDANESSESSSSSLSSESSSSSSSSDSSSSSSDFSMETISLAIKNGTPLEDIAPESIKKQIEKINKIPADNIREHGMNGDLKEIFQDVFDQPTVPKGE
jgi:hypothetical protein